MNKCIKIKQLIEVMLLSSVMNIGTELEMTTLGTKLL